MGGDALVVSLSVSPETRRDGRGGEKALHAPAQIVILNPMELMPPEGTGIHFSGPKAFNDGYSVSGLDQLVTNICIYSS